MSTPSMPEAPDGSGVGPGAGPVGPTGPASGPVGPTRPASGPIGPTGPADGPAPPHSPIHTQPHTPPHQPAHPPNGSGRLAGPLTVPLGKMLYLCVAALGIINLCLGFVNNGDGLVSVNLYKAGVAVFALAPTLLFLAGLVAVRGWLPGERSPGALPAMITTAIFVALALSAFGSNGAGDLQTFFLVFGGLQLVIAWLAYLFDAGVIAGR
ncbi:MAG: DUF5336 domain-containing protein [Catenulispora sp.]|nr:DUF5336 domain-containing protein [Catenulispora sp.]